MVLKREQERLGVELRDAVRPSARDSGAVRIGYRLGMRLPAALPRRFRWSEGGRLMWVWKPEWKAIGVVIGVQRRTINASIKIPMTATAGTVRGIDIAIEEFERSSGGIMSFMIIDDPDEPLDGHPIDNKPSGSSA
jgi:hypothetical protein